jgi:hypothetical protein
MMRIITPGRQKGRTQQTLPFRETRDKPEGEQLINERKTQDRSDHGKKQMDFLFIIQMNNVHASGSLFPFMSSLTALSSSCQLEFLPFCCSIVYFLLE